MRQSQEDRALLLLELATTVTGTLDLQVVLDASFAALRRLLDFGGGAIQLVEDGHLVAAATDPPMAPEARTVRIPVGQGVSGVIAATGEPIYIPDISVDERVHPEGRRKGISAGVRSYFGMPLILSGGPIGVVQVDAPDVDAFDGETRALVLAFVPTIAAAVQNARVFDQEREAIRRREEVDRLKRNFISIVSHELRTPMGITLGFAQTLAERVDELTRDQVADLAGRVHTSGRRLQRLLEDLLYASDLETGLLDVSLRPTDVGSLVASLTALDLRVDHDIEIDVDEALDPVLADPDRLRQAVGHLVANAAKFSNDGAPVRILAHRDPDGGVVVAVEDRGPGIPAEARQRIFDLFVQAEDAMTRSTGGLGIGLYVVRRLADEMRARVSVSERAGGGTRIAMHLPAA